MNDFFKKKAGGFFLLLTLLTVSTAKGFFIQENANRAFSPNRDMPKIEGVVSTLKKEEQSSKNRSRFFFSKLSHPIPKKLISNAQTLRFNKPLSQLNLFNFFFLREIVASKKVTRIPLITQEVLKNRKKHSTIKKERSKATSNSVHVTPSTILKIAAYATLAALIPAIPIFLLHLLVFVPATMTIMGNLHKFHIFRKNKQVDQKTQKNKSHPKNKKGSDVQQESKKQKEDDAQQQSKEQSGSGAQQEPPREHTRPALF